MTAKIMDDSDNPREPDEIEKFSGFYLIFLPQLVKSLLYRGASMYEAVDIAQSTMIEAFKDWRNIVYPKSWTRAVAYNLLKSLKTRNKENPVEDLPEHNLLLLCHPIDPETWAELHEILRLLARLPPRQREVMAWTLEGYRPSQIAAELQITPEAVRSSLKKAREFLRKYLCPPKDER